MKIKRSRLIQEFWILATIIAIILCNLHVYRSQILGSYNYYLPINWRFEDAIFFAGMGMVCFFSLPRQIKQPSDLFFFAYGIFAVLGVGTYLQAIFHFTASDLTIIFLLLTLPILVIFLIGKVTLRQSESLIRRSSRNVRGLRYFTPIVFFCTATLIVTEWPLSISLEQLYDIRAGTKSSAYLSGTLAGALVPALAFIAGVFRNAKIAFISLSIALLMVLAAGIKGQVFYSAFALFLGMVWGAGAWQRVYKFLFLGVILCYLIILLEGFPSVIAEFVARRVFMVPGVGVGAHLELLHYEYVGQFSALNGLDSDSQITYLVGEVIYGSGDSNANTVGFVHAYGSGGLWRYFLAIVLAGIYFFLINFAYIRSGNPLSLVAGFLFSAVIVEQSVFTAMLSSGMVALLLIIYLQFINPATISPKPRGELKSGNLHQERV